MRSKLRSSRFGRWLTLTACTLTITGSLFSCSISANAGRQPSPDPAIGQVITAPWR